MKSTFTIILLLSITTVGICQLAEPLYFREKVHDFGEVLEHNGPVDFEYVFTNNSSRPVRILTVQASCGCTTPGWTKEAVAPGKTGFIKASFDPKGRPGYFNKSLMVTTDLSANPITLQIKGTVVDKLSSKEELLPVVNGNLRLKSASINVGKIYLNKEPIPFDFAVLNDGKERIEFREVLAPTYIKVVTPPSLDPGARGVVQIIYNAKMKNQYGFQSDNIELKTSDSKDAVKSFSVYATIEEYFPVLSAEELAKAPLLQLEKTDVQLSRIKQGVSVEQSFRYTNTGKKNLEMRAIQSNCSCVVAAYDKHVLKPGESGVITFEFNSTGRTGTQNKAITIYSNDPRNPLQRVMVSTFIED